MKPNVAAFTAPFDLLEEDLEHWDALYRCRNCGALWIVEEGRECDRETNVATRILTVLDWRKIDRWQARRELLIADNGGEDDRPCGWAGCPRRVLHGKEVCVDHAYGRTAMRDQPIPGVPVRFRIESLLTAREIVFARRLDDVDFSLGERSTLGGRAMEHFDMPRKLTSDGTVDLQLFGFFLGDPSDVAGFGVGDIVWFDSDGTASG